MWFPEGLEDTLFKLHILFQISGSFIMVVGGWGSDIYRDDVQIIDLSPHQMFCPNLQNYPLKMSEATGAIISGDPIICGGFSILAYSRYPECYKYENSTNSWTFLTNMTIGRAFSGSVPLNDSLFVMGGSCDSHGYGLSTTEYLSVDGNASQTKEIFKPFFVWLLLKWEVQLGDFSLHHVSTEYFWHI
jgi:hypothetical protein